MNQEYQKSLLEATIKDVFKGKHTDGELPQSVLGVESAPRNWLERLLERQKVIVRVEGVPNWRLYQEAATSNGLLFERASYAVSLDLIKSRGKYDIVNPNPDMGKERIASVHYNSRMKDSHEVMISYADNAKKVAQILIAYIALARGS